MEYLKIIPDCCWGFTAGSGAVVLLILTESHPLGHQTISTSIGCPAQRHQLYRPAQMFS